MSVTYTANPVPPRQDESNGTLHAKMAANEEFSGNALDALKAVEGTGQTASELSRQSLYVKFDPLVDTPDKKAQELPASTGATTPQASKPLIDAPTPGRHYTAEEVQTKMNEAAAQAAEETQIAMMEVEDLRAQLKAALQQNKQMKEVVEEYSEAMGKMIAQTDSEKGDSNKEVVRLKAEVAQAEEDLRKTETAFSDLHRKYEKTKGIVDNLRANEGKLKAAVEDAQSKLTVSEQRYQKLKDHAEGRIHSANESIAGVRDEFSTQIKALQAKLKKADMDNNRLARQVEAKEQDNKELTAICDDLVAQLDGKGA